MLVNGRYMMDASPVPRRDLPRLHLAEAFFIFGDGREKRIYKRRDGRAL